MQKLATTTTGSGEPTFLLAVGEEEGWLIAAAIRTVLGEIDPVEFRTRLGVGPAEAASLLDDRNRAGPMTGRSRPVDASDGAAVGARLHLTEDQRLLVNNALNELLHGPSLPGAPPSFRRADATVLLGEVGKLLDGIGPHPNAQVIGGGCDVDQIR